MSVNNLETFGVYYAGLITTCISHRADIIAGISFRNDTGVSYTGINNLGTSQINLINSLGTTLTNLNTFLGTT